MKIVGIRAIGIGLLAVFTVACGGGGGSSVGSPPVAATETGTFVDSPVAGLTTWRSRPT